MNAQNESLTEETVEENGERSDALTATEPVDTDRAKTEEGTLDDALAESEDSTDVPNAEEINYEELIARDLEELKREFSELSSIESITELKNPLRYAALRDLGLTASEAYLATAGKARAKDNRAHLKTSAPRAAGGPPSSMSRQELECARELFSGMTDAQIQHLYKKVTR